MEVTIKWTSQAEKGLDKVLLYLEKEWTSREIIQLKENIQETIKHISTNPKLYPQSKKHKNLHKAIVDKNNYLVYRVNLKKQIIEIINFKGTKQKPIH